MRTEKIKPIPKYIIEKIKRFDRKYHTTPSGATRYYSYLTKNDGELVKVTVAVRDFKNNWYCKQVAVHGLHSKECFVKDMVFYYIGGYFTGWYSEGINKHQKHYEYDEWGYADDKYFNPYAPTINKEYIDKFPEFKYSAYKGCNMDAIEYLRIYEKHPQTEYLIKAGLASLIKSNQILNKIATDKNFRKYLYKNAEIIKKDNFYVQSILKAYRTGKALEDVQELEKSRKALNLGNFKVIRELFHGRTDVYLEYIAKNKISNACYKDYLNACNYLNIDMTLDKNCLPNDFMKWHDIRIDEYRTKIALEDKEKRQALYDKFALVADKYTSLQQLGKGVFVCLIAKSPAELIREGEILHHCVGRMNYDQKFIREETLIFFIRSANEPDKPLVTIEYSLSKKSILQCYAEHNSKPSQEIENFIYNKWLPYANRKLKKLAA